MICCIVLKSDAKSQKLVFNRHDQNLLTAHLESNLSYKPFVFNSNKGLYIFVKKKDSFEKIQKILTDFCEEDHLQNFNMYDTTPRPFFFSAMTHEILTSTEISALGWKRFISSFLMQINPYDANTSVHSIGIFKRFKNNIKRNGTRLQKKFFKRRMKMLRERVSIESIENILNLD